MTPPVVSTQESPSSITRVEIIKEAKRIEESCLYSSKGHFVAAQIWSRFHLMIGIPSVVVAAIAGTSAFTNHSVVAGVSSIIVTVLTSIATFLNPKERAASHFSSGNSYGSLESKIRRFWSIECKSDDPEKLLAHKLEEYSNTRDRLNQESTQISRWAYEKGKKLIEDGEAEYAVDKRPTA